MSFNTEEQAERRSNLRTPKVCYNASGQPKTALVLTGGGARAAYQVGALKAVSQLIFKSHCGNPFPIVTGTSAGAINATVFASYAQKPSVGIRSLEKVWQNFSVDQVFRSDIKGIIHNAARWSKSLFIQDYHIKLERFMMVLPLWIGWNKNKKEELQLPLQQLLVLGTFQLSKEKK